MGIKHIIIVTYDAIGEQAHVQAHFKGTDLIFPGIGFHHLPVIVVLMGEQIINSFVDPVIMAVRIGTGAGIALCFLHKAYLFLGCQDYCLKTLPLLTQQLEGIVRHRAGDGLGWQI